eukprot:CCRYP_005479-RA/>CCRYP_005479-RA protein AED:0.47 eAED:0.47 QI:0/-1/0/1/-1/1/1/0/229
MSVGINRVHHLRRWLCQPQCTIGDAFRPLWSKIPSNSVGTLSNLPSRGMSETRKATVRQTHNDRKLDGSSPTFYERLRELRSNGTPEIFLGSAILFLVGIDYALQIRNDDDRKTMMRQLEREVETDAEESRREVRERIRDGTGNKFLFKCVVRRVPQFFDGHRCLTNIKVGDVLNVIEEGVGPGNQYNLCSIDRSQSRGKVGDESDAKGVVSIGWFPCSCLELVNDREE